MIKKNLRKIIYLIIIIIITILLLVNENGVLKYLKLRSEIHRLDSKIEEIKTRIKKLDLEIDSLKTSDVKMEQVARDKYRMKMKNEVPIKIDRE